MSSFKRITQSTFDEAVQENMEEFEMSKEEAVHDATKQFLKQGIDLSNIDTTVGEGRQELLDIIQILQDAPVPIPNNEIPLMLTHLQFIVSATQKAHPLYKRNIVLMYHQGGLNALHTHFNETEDFQISLAIVKLISDLSSSSLEIRDFFEPNGSKNMVLLLDLLLVKISDAIKVNKNNVSSNSQEWLLLTALVTLGKIVAKSEKNKTALMKAGIANELIKIFDLFVPFFRSSTSSSSSSSSLSVITSASAVSLQQASSQLSSFIHLLEKTCLLLRELCVFNDTRSEMSSTFDNGKYFIKQSTLIPNLVTMVQQYYNYPLLSSNALLAMKSMITTNEAVQIIALHGIIELLSEILQSYTEIIMQLADSSNSGLLASSSSNTTGKPQTSSNDTPSNRPIRTSSTSEEDDEAEKKNEKFDKENEEEENEIDLQQQLTPSAPSSTKSTPSSSVTNSTTNPLLLLRAIIALIRNIIADDQKKEKFVSCGALQSLIIIFLYSQKISSSSANNLSNNHHKWDIANDYYLIEHLFGCFAQFTLRSPRNSLTIMKDHYLQFLPLLIVYMQKFATQDSLHRQVCLMLHNIINRIPEYKQILLDYHFDDILQSITRDLPTVKDECYVLLRDLGINIQYMKRDEVTGKLVPVYETFGSSTNKNFRPVYDESHHIQDRIAEEAKPPLRIHSNSGSDRQSFQQQDQQQRQRQSSKDYSENDHDHGHGHAHNKKEEGTKKEGICCDEPSHYHHDSHDHSHDHSH